MRQKALFVVQATSTGLTIVGSLSLLYADSGASFLSMRIGGSLSLVLGFTNLIFLSSTVSKWNLWAYFVAPLLSLLLSLPTLLKISDDGPVDIVNVLAFLVQCGIALATVVTCISIMCCNCCGGRSTEIGSSVTPSTKTMLFCASISVALVLLLVALHPLYCTACPDCSDVDTINIGEGGGCYGEYIFDEQLGDYYVEEENVNGCFCVNHCAVDGCWNGCSARVQNDDELFCYSVEGSSGPYVTGVGSVLALICAFALMRLPSSSGSSTRSQSEDPATTNALENKEESDDSIEEGKETIIDQSEEVGGHYQPGKEDITETEKTADLEA